MRNRIGIACAIGILSAFFISASLLFAEDRVHNVTQDKWYDTIQAALNEANSGDSLVALAGTYYENISWPSRDGIKLYSQSGAESTIIDASAAGRVVNFGSSGLTNATVLDGFTITNGANTYGAGIYAYSSPTISKNIITNNVAISSDRNYGGGIHCAYQSAPHIVGNVISYNTISGGYWNYGGGIYCDMYVTAVIEGNYIVHNSSTGGDRGYGIGIFVYYDATPRIANNIIAQNVASSGSWNYGAGIKSEGSPAIVGNTIVQNKCQGGSWCYGGGIWCGREFVNVITNNVIVQNSVGGGTWNYGGGIYCEDEAIPTISYNDVWGNTPQNYYNCSPGVGDISEDPLFVDGPNEDYHLAKGSPCLDMGDPAYVPTPDEMDIDGNPRVISDRVDMGADETMYIVWVSIVPDATEVPRGGRLGYTVTVTNDTDFPAELDYWTDVYLWTGEPYKKNPILGPMHGTLPAGVSKSKHVSHKVPNKAPLKTYTCFGRIGSWPDDVWFEDSFEFTVIE